LQAIADARLRTPDAVRRDRNDLEQAVIATWQPSKK